ncbi:hypothetical protein AAFL31_03650 [Klebsiella huaxiensis]|uniref:YmjE family protein n=1 Tax=Klebsiella huaxiensis TaxID=2153354 RepID=UPI003163E0B4
MMQMFKYPQGEGGRPGRMECAAAAARRFFLPFDLPLTPLRSWFVFRSLRPQTQVCSGGNDNGY